jgi:D-amino peptidase
MKIYVICDLEGTAGVIDHRQQCWFNGAYYAQARRLATLELNAIVEGVLEAGATEVVAWDGHGNFPGGLDSERVHPSCQVIIGAGDGGPVGLNASYDAMFLCGFHAMAGTAGGVLDHSFEPEIAGCWVNEISWGEIAMNCYTAGQHGVPTVFMSGDRAAIHEAKTVVPNITTAIVKEGLATAPLWLSPAPTRSLSPEKARELIRDTAKRAIGEIAHIEPYVLEPPYTIRTQFTKQRRADMIASRPDIQRIDAFTVEATSCKQLELLM